MYIPELSYLTDHCSHRSVPHHLRRISSQRCWMILIECRTDGYWKSGSWIFPIVLVIKKGDLWRFCGVILTRPTFPCRPRWTHPTLLTLLTLTLTPHSLQTQLYQHLVAVGSVGLKRDKFWPTLWSIDFLIDFWTEKPGDGDAFRWTRIGRWKKCQITHPFITWPIYQQICGDAYQRTKIYGWQGWAVSIFNQRHPH